MPSPLNWYYKIVGAPSQMSDTVKRQYPDVDLAFLQLQSQMPKEAAAVNSIRPTNWLESTIVPDAYMRTYPNNTIAFNPALFQYMKQEGLTMDDLLAHELTHVKQNQQSGIIRSWYRNLFGSNDQAEAEAYATEARRKAIRKDVNLPAERSAKRSAKK